MSDNCKSRSFFPADRSYLFLRLVSLFFIFLRLVVLLSHFFFSRSISFFFFFFLAADTDTLFHGAKRLGHVFTTDPYKPFGDPKHLVIVFLPEDLLAVRGSFGGDIKLNNADTICKLFDVCWKRYVPVLLRGVSRSKPSMKDDVYFSCGDTTTIRRLRYVPTTPNLTSLMTHVERAARAAGVSLDDKPTRQDVANKAITTAMDKMSRHVRLQSDYVISGSGITAYKRSTGQLVSRNNSASVVYTLFTLPSMTATTINPRPTLFVKRLLGLQNWSIETIYCRFWHIGWYLAGLAARGAYNLQQFVYDMGEAGSGKGVFFNLIMRFLGQHKEAIACIAISSPNRFMWSPLYDGRCECVFLNEYRAAVKSNDKAVMERGLLQLTSGEHMSVERKNKPIASMSMSGIATWGNGNYPIRMSDYMAGRGQALSRRIIIFPYTTMRSLADAQEGAIDPRIYNTEMEAILRISLQTYHLCPSDPPESTQMLLARLIADEIIDPIELFIQTCVVSNPSGELNRKALMDEFKHFCRTVCVVNFHLTNEHMSKTLLELRMSTTQIGVPGYSLVRARYTDPLTTLSKLLTYADTEYVAAFTEKMTKATVRKNPSTISATSWATRVGVPLPTDPQ